YRVSFSWPSSYNGDGGLSIMTVYTPGPVTGVGPDGVFSNPIPGSVISENMRRNFYSTKFVTLDSLRDSGGYSEQQTNNVIYSEGEMAVNQGPDRKQNSFLNALDPEVIASDLNSIKY